MPARPAIIVGLGSSGSEVAVQIYKTYQKYLKQNPDVNPNTVQFLLIDTDNPVSGSEDLGRTDHYLSIGNPNGDLLYDAMWEHDPFFRVWWYDNFTRVGRMYPGAGTTSPKGRLAFWSTLGTPSNSNNIENTLSTLMARASAAAADHDVAWVPVYIICTICGGTGAGMAIDTAYMIRKVQRGATNAEIHGVLMLPSVPLMRATTPYHQHIRANGYGFMVALNYWMTSNKSRPVEIAPFMERGNRAVVIKGDKSPFDVCWMISAKNEKGFSLLSWPDVKSQVAESVSMMVFEQGADGFQSRLNDFISDPVITGGEYGGQPSSYGSFASYSLRYSPDKAAEYLASYYGQQAIIHFRKTSPEGAAAAKSLAITFMRTHEIQEKSDEDPNQPMDQVLTRLRQAIPDRIVYDDVNIDQRLNQRKVKDQASLLAEIKLMVSEENSILTAQDKRKAGIPYLQQLEANREDFAEKVLFGEQTQRAEVSGLYQTVQWQMEDHDDGLARAQSFLTELRSLITEHRQSLVDELEGLQAAGRIGEEAQLRDMEGEDNLKDVGKKGAREMFGGLFSDKRKGILLVKKGFWVPWVNLKKDILTKRQAIQFYDALLREINKLLTILSEQVVSDLQAVESTILKTGRESLGRRIGANEATVEDLVLQDEKLLIEHFGPKATEAAHEGRMIVTYHTWELIQSLRKEPKVEEREEIRSAFREKLQGQLRHVGHVHFDRATRELTLWDALKVEAKSKGTEPKKYIVERTQSMFNKCIPYWHLNTGKHQALVLRMPVIQLYSFDTRSLDDFAAREGLDLNLDDLFVATNETRPERSDVDSSPYEFKIFIARGGAPIYFMTEPEECLADFQGWRSTQSVPILLDKRLEAYLKVSGEYPFNIKVGGASDELYYFLMAEHFGVIDSPLIRTKGINSSGTYKYPAQTINLGTKRWVAIASLQRGGKYDRYMEDISQLVKERMSRMSLDDRLNAHVETYYYLWLCANSTPDPTIKEELQKQANLVADTISSEFGYSRMDIEDMTKEFEESLQEQAAAEPEKGEVEEKPKPKPARRRPTTRRTPPKS